MIFKLAMRYLSAPISSVASEREFKSARDIANGDRVRLLPKNVEKLLFLKHNLRSIGFNTVALPSGDNNNYGISDDSSPEHVEENTSDSEANTSENEPTD